MKKKFLLSILMVLFAICVGAFGACANPGASDPEDGPEEEVTSVVKFADSTYSVELYSNITLNPNYKGTETLTWTSSNTDIVLVDNGVVFGKTAGAAEVTVSVGEDSAKCTITVSQTNAYPTLSLGQDAMEIAKTASKTICPSIINNAGTVLSNVFVNYAYESLNEEILTVTNAGVVTGVGVGQAEVKVTATFSDVTITEYLVVDVRENVLVSFSKSATELYSNSLKGELATSEQLNVYVYEDNQLKTNPAITYSAEDPSVVSVSDTGLVTGLKQGRTSVYASYTTASNFVVTTAIDVRVEFPVVTLADGLLFEVFGDKNGTVDFNAYADYFDEDLTSVKVYDDLDKTTSATIEDGVVTLVNRELSYGFRKLNFIINDELVFEADAEIITKVIRTAKELATFAEEYGGRYCPGCASDPPKTITGNYEGYFVLGNDIDMTGQLINHCYGHNAPSYSPANETYGFSGIFDGKGYTVYNIEYNLFSRISDKGVVKNLSIVTETVPTNGAIAAIFSGTLENCYLYVNLSEYIDATGSIGWNTLGRPLLKNVVIEVPAIHNAIISVSGTPVAKQSALFFTAKEKFDAQGVFITTPAGSEQLFSRIDAPGFTEQGTFEGTINHYSEAGQKKFDGFDKTSGLWEFVGDRYRFKTATWWLLDPIEAVPDVDTFVKGENGSLTWDEVEGADGYIVEIDDVPYYTETNSYVGIPSGAVVRVKAAGDGELKRDSAYSDKYLYIDLPEGYLADFSSQGYLAFIESDRGYPISNYNVEIGSYYGLDNVLKISGTAANGNYVLKINLPKAMTNNVATKNKTQITLQMYVAEYGTGTFGLFQTTDGGWEGLNYTPVRNQWYYHTTVVNTGDNIRVGITEGDYEFYIAAVVQGGKDVIINNTKAELASELEGSELATMSDTRYLDMLDNIAIAKVDSYHGREGVLKIDATAATNAMLTLPKATTATTFTARFYVVGGETEKFGTGSNMFAYDRGEWVTAIWTDVALTDNKINLAWEAGIEAIYIDGIWEGDCREAIGGDVAYTVEYYLQNFEDDNYTLALEYSGVVEGTAGSFVSVTPTEIVTYTFVPELSTLSGTVEAGLVLKLYYNRNTYNVSIVTNMPDAGTFTDASGAYKAGAEVTVTAVTGDVYRFLGWFDNKSGAKVSGAEEFTFTVKKDVEYIVKWESDPNAPLKRELAKTLGENELANFDSQEYLKLLENDRTYGGNHSFEIGTFMGKENVLKVTASSAAGGIRITLPKAMTTTASGKTDITIQLYIVKTGGSTFGLYQTDKGGWESLHFATVKTNQWYCVERNVNVGDNVRFGTAGGGEVEFYVSVIVEGKHGDEITKNEVVGPLLETLGENELAGFDSQGYLSLVDAGSYPYNCTIGTFHEKEGVLKVKFIGSGNSFIKLTLPKKINAGDTITIKYYLETAGLGYGSVGIMQNGGWGAGDGFPTHSSSTGTTPGLAVGEWAEWTVTMTGEYDYLRFYFSASATICIDSIVVVTAE